MIQYSRLQLYTTCGCQSQEEAEAKRRKRTYLTVGGVAVNCPVVTTSCVINSYKLLFLKHTKNVGLEPKKHGNKVEIKDGGEDRREEYPTSVPHTGWYK